MIQPQSQSTFRANILAYVRGMGHLGALGQMKQKYQSKVAPGAESRYGIDGKGNCFWHARAGASYADQAGYAIANGLDPTNLTWSQLRALFGDSPVPVREAGTGVFGWYIGRGGDEGQNVGAGICHKLNLGVTGFNVATPDGGLVAIPPGAFTKGMGWDDLVQVIPAPPPSTGAGPGGSIAVAAAAAAATCAPGYQRPPAGGHITCLPGYGWIADASGCEQCQPLCSTGWLPPDQFGSQQCPAGEQLVVDPRTRCVRCMRLASCFKQGENPVQCPAPFVLEARGEYTCCVAPTGGQQSGQQQAQQAQQASVTSTTSATPTTIASVPMSTGAKVALGVAAVLALAAIFGGKGK